MKFSYLNRDMKHMTLVAWRGERVCFEARLTGNLSGTLGYIVNKMGYTINIKFKGLYATMANNQKVWDVIAPYKPGKTDKIWIIINIPTGAIPGFYRHPEIALTVQILHLCIPHPKKWSFHLDLWQNPWAVARCNRVKPWSDAHFHILEQHLRVLADAGQKVVTTTVVDDAWKGQTYDVHGSMVKWIDPSGSINNPKELSKVLEFDFTIFIRYVECCERAGITDQISVFSILPWGTNRGCGAKDGAAKYKIHCKLSDKNKMAIRHLEMTPGTQTYHLLWRKFLHAFGAMLVEKGWEKKVHFAFDERNKDDMKAALTMLERETPASLRPIRTSSAYEYNDEYTDRITDLSIGLNTGVNWRNISRNRRSKGQKTSFYLCEWPKPPSANTFLTSPIHQSKWVGWYAAANGLDGFLRWAYDSWPKKPLLSGDFPGPHGNWPPGDTFLCYPNAWGSRRLAMLRQGIQDYEKIKILMGHFDVSELLSPFLHNQVVSLKMMVKGQHILDRMGQKLAHVCPRANIYILRHGDRFDHSHTTIWNKRCKIFREQGLKCDQRDTPLSRVGIRQAREVSEYLKQNSIDIDSVYSSPYLRTLQTADIVAGVFDICVKVEKGLSEGCHRDVQESWKLLTLPYLDIDYKSIVEPLAIEPEHLFQHRVDKLGFHIKNNFMGNSLIVSHAATSIQLVSSLLQVDRRDLGKIGACELIHVTILEDGSAHLVQNFFPHDIPSSTQPWGF